jgi:hypothetical protein
VGMPAALLLQVWTSVSLKNSWSCSISVFNLLFHDY